MRRRCDNAFVFLLINGNVADNDDNIDETRGTCAVVLASVFVSDYACAVHLCGSSIFDGVGFVVRGVLLDNAYHDTLASLKRSVALRSRLIE